LRNKTPKCRVKAKLRDDRRPATRPNETWAMDFVHDQLATGRKIRVPTVVDTFSRYAPAIDPRFSYRGEDVVRILEKVCLELGYRTDHRLGDDRGGARCHHVPIRAPVCGLARSHPAPAELRRQGTARRHKQAGRRLSATAARRGRHGSDAHGAERCQPTPPWVVRLLTHKPVKIATVAIANKTARIAWAVMSRNEVHMAPAV